MVTTPGHLGTLVTVHLPAEHLDDLVKGGRVLVTWEVPGTYGARHATGTVAQVIDLAVRHDHHSVSTDAELHEDRLAAVRHEQDAHAPECEHHVPRHRWCEDCQREWEGE